MWVETTFPSYSPATYALLLELPPFSTNGYWQPVVFVYGDSELDSTHNKEPPPIKANPSQHEQGEGEQGESEQFTSFTLVTP